MLSGVAEHRRTPEETRGESRDIFNCPCKNVRAHDGGHGRTGSASAWPERPGHNLPKRAALARCSKREACTVGEGCQRLFLGIWKS